MKRFLLFLIVSVVNTAMALTPVQTIGQAFLDQGWRQVPCIDAFAIGQANAEDFAAAEARGDVMCFRTIELNIAEDAPSVIDSIVPGLDWSDQFLARFLYVKEFEFKGEELIFAAFPVTGNATVGLLEFRLDSD